MKYFARLSLMGSGLGLILLMASPSFAQVLNFGGNGVVIVTPNNITFSNSDTVTGTSSEVGTGTTLDGLTAGEPISIDGGNAISPTSTTLNPNGSYPVDVPITFGSTPDVSLTLTEFGPGVSNTDCAGLTIGGTCSPLTPLGPSPIILTDDGTGTTAILPVSGTFSDNGSVSDVSGEFSANIAGETPEQLASQGSFTTTWSGQLTSSSAVPEPRFVSLIALLGLLMGAVVLKRRKSIA